MGVWCNLIRNVLLANISLDTPANLFERELSSSSTTPESSLGAEASVGAVLDAWIGTKDVSQVGVGQQEGEGGGVRQWKDGGWVGSWCWWRMRRRGVRSL